MNTRTIIFVTAFLGFLIAVTATAFQYLKPQPSATLVSPLSYTPREVSDEAPSDVLAAVVQEEVSTPSVSPSVSPSPRKINIPAPTPTPTPTEIPAIDTIDAVSEILLGRGREEPVDPRAVKREKLGKLDWCVPNHVRYNSNLPLCSGPVDPVVQAFRDCVGKLQNYRPPDFPRDLWMEDITNRCIDEANI